MACPYKAKDCYLLRYPLCIYCDRSMLGFLAQDEAQGTIHSCCP